jgi:hypothetical protein
MELGLIGNAVGASFAVLVAEELYLSEHVSLARRLHATRDNHGHVTAELP